MRGRGVESVEDTFLYDLRVLCDILLFNNYERRIEGVRMEFKDTIVDLLDKGYEGGYWDYKSDYPDTVEEKLHDIICMANNLENRDAYLIYGANDDGTICGIENTQKTRYKTSDIIKFLRTKPFAGGYIPQVEVKILQLEGHEIDVLVILQGLHTPYYLQEEFNKTKMIGGKRVESIKAGAIYTRTADINTPREGTASIEHTEYLWRKRFGFDMQPFKRFQVLLNDINGWSETNWDNCRQQYHCDYPEYRIIAKESSDAYSSISYFYDDERMLYAELNLNYLSTTLYETELWYMDLGRCIIPKPEQQYLIEKGLFYFYYVKTDINGKLLGLFSKGKYKCYNRNGQEMPFIIFENYDEKEKFEEWMLNTDPSLILTIKDTIKENAIMEHILAKEAMDGKPVVGVMEIAVSYSLYLRWHNEFV